MRALPLLGLLACADKADDSAVPDPLVSGTVQPEGASESGEVAFHRGFAFDQGGRVIAYISSNPAASCDRVVEYLRPHEEPYDPSGLLTGGTCDLYFAMDGYSGDLSADDDPMAVAGWALNCAMGEGSFVLETRDSGDRDYYWSGRWWQGRPTSYSYTLTGGAGADFTFDLQMSAYDGGFIYESMEGVPATGEVSGSIDLEWCPSLATTGLF
jgi:hypothetical protein